MRLFNRLRRKLNYLDDAKIEQIHQACLMALAAHQGSKTAHGRGLYYSSCCRRLYACRYEDGSSHHYGSVVA